MKWRERKYGMKFKYIYMKRGKKDNEGEKK